VQNACILQYSIVWYRTEQYNAVGVRTAWVPGRPGGSNLYGDT